jgi:hypothetical protein
MRLEAQIEALLAQRDITSDLQGLCRRLYRITTGGRFAIRTTRPPRQDALPGRSKALG